MLRGEKRPLGRGGCFLPLSFENSATSLFDQCLSPCLIDGDCFGVFGKRENLGRIMGRYSGTAWGLTDSLGGNGCFAQGKGGGGGAVSV